MVAMYDDVSRYGDDSRLVSAHKESKINSDWLSQPLSCHSSMTQNILNIDFIQQC